MQDRREAELEGFRTEGMQETSFSGLEGNRKKGFRTCSRVLMGGVRNKRDAGHDSHRKCGMQDRWDER